MSKKYSDLKNDLGDLIRDADFISNNDSIVLRATNRALSDIDLGDTGEGNTQMYGYHFQVEIQDIPFDNEITGTITTAGTTTLIDSARTFITDGITKGDVVENTTDVSVCRVVSVDSQTQLTVSALKNGTDNDFDVSDAYIIYGVNYKIDSSWNYKFPKILRLAQDQDTEFEYVSPDDFERKKYITQSGQYNYTVDFQNGTECLKISYETKESMQFEFYSHNMVLDDDGSARKMIMENDNDTVLIPDSHYYTLVELSAGYILQQKDGETSDTSLTHLKDGRRRLKLMCNSIGVYQKSPVQKLRVRGEWFHLHKTSNDND